jgi:hypothetical protein
VKKCVSSFDRLILFVAYLARGISPGPPIQRLSHKTHLHRVLQTHFASAGHPPAACLFLPGYPLPQPMYNDTIYLFQMTCLFTAYLSWHTNKKAFCRLDSLIQVMCPVFLCQHTRRIFRRHLVTASRRGSLRSRHTFRFTASVRPSTSSSRRRIERTSERLTKRQRNG